MLFIYRNAANETGIRHIIQVSELDDYYEGICQRDGQHKTFRKDRILELLDDLTGAEEKLAHHLSNTIIKQASNRLNPLGKQEICFSGFKVDDSARLSKLALEKDMFVRTCVTVKLTYLCIGYNAGPSKMEKAKQMGIPILREYDFLNLITTGELPIQ